MHRPLEVLLVDDDRVTLAYLRELVVRLGAIPTAVADANAGRIALAARAFDLVICDLRLPDASGASLLSNANGAVFVATSAHVDAALARRLRRLGFASVIEKPVSSGVLAALVDQHFGARGQVPETIADTARWERRPEIALVDPVTPYRVPRRRPHPAAMLDDDAALLACGSAEVVGALRPLLADELRRTRVHIRQALRTRRTAVAREALHKLAASCALVGATPLRIAAASLMRSIDGGGPDRQVALAFDRTAGKTLVALQLPRT